MTTRRAIPVVVWLALGASAAGAAEDLPNEIAPLIDVTGTTAVSLGAMFSTDAHPDGNLISLGAGLELSVVRYLGTVGDSDRRVLGLGGFLHGEALGLGTDDVHGYAALGAQINYLSLGLEAGAAAELFDEAHADTLFFHVAPFLSLGVVWIGLHVDVPLVGLTAGPLYGAGYGIEIGGQLPLFIGDRPQVEGARLRGPFGGG